MTSRCNRRLFVQRLGGVAAVAPLVPLGWLSQSVRVRRVGFLIGGPPTLAATFRQAMRDLGYVEGRDLELDMREDASGDAMQRHATELATGPCEVVVAGALPFALALRRANPAKPIVIATGPGLVSNGFAKSLEHPGGNVTGMEELAPGISARRLTLLKRLAPSASRIGLLSTTPGQGGHELQAADAAAVAPSLGVTLKVYRAASLPEIETALATMVSDGMNGMANFQGGLSLQHRQLIVDYAATHRLPAVYQATMFPEAGGLMSWAPDLNQQFRVAAGYVDQILKGANPGDLPIRHPEKYFWTVNETAAKNLGLTLTAAVRSEIDRIVP